MPRLLFEKKGNAIWISHLDLMRLFQRAFKRAGLPLTHTKGFNPRPSVSIALPLSVGIESSCELLDFDLDGEPIAESAILEKLNRSLVDGVQVLDVYTDGNKIKNLAYLDCEILLTYDDGIPPDAIGCLEALFSRPEVLVEKKSKNGISEQNIVSMIRQLHVTEETQKQLKINARVCCQNPSLNPMQIHAAILRYLPDLTPSFAECRRMEIFDTNENIFR